MRLRRSRMTCLTALLGCHALTACSSWQSRDLQLGVNPNTEVLVTRRDGTKLVVVGATVQGDTVRGFGLRRSADAPPPVIAMPMSEVERMQVRQHDGGRTFLLAAGLTAALAALLTVIATAVAANALLEGG